MSDTRLLPIPGWKGYFVTREGEIVSRVRGNPRVLKQGVHPQGYRCVTLTNSGVHKSFLVHRLVLLAFIGECPNGMVVNHKNGIKCDNRLENLEYITQQENVRHSMDVLGVQSLQYERKQRGEQNNGAKLTEVKVREIRERAVNKTPLTILAKEYEVSYQTIFDVVHRKKWRHVT